ncbi:hypothetical protein [Pelovirga terrestris]|uniref:Uncharacterized protein n=1 Tax=Pelovirga terrestris TaxID=2771352 RepID=A0A8J6QYA3_9BACT|nr:hypothetical protein [Pelovirga terrestris]MBD1401661.1 hypothetical protein [Pelovirga terrestris]
MMRGKWKRWIWCVIALGSLVLGACGGGGGGDKIEMKLASVADIIVDGDGSDWDNIEPLVVDKSGDGSSEFTGTDAKSISMAISPDRSTLYIMMDFYDGIPNPIFASGDTPDVDPIVGLPVQQGYQIHFDKDSDGSVYFFTIMVRWDDEEGWIIWKIHSPMERPDVQDMATIAVNEIIEISIPFTAIGSPKELFFKGEVTTSAVLRKKEMIPDFGPKYWPKVVFP